MARATIEDPLKAFRFTIEESGFKRAGFQEANGLEASVEVAEYREGGDNETVRKSAGLTTYANITLRRGQIIGGSEGGEDDMLDWFTLVQDVTTAGNANQYRKDLELVQYDAQFSEARRWEILEAWPARFKPFSDQNAQGNDNSIEELELAHEGFSLVA